MRLADRKREFLAYRANALSLFATSRGPDLCGNCRFFYRDNAEPPMSWGRCRKRAPGPKMELLINLDRLYPGVWWPETHHQFWCGDYRRTRWWHRNHRP